MSLAKVKADAQEYMLLHPELGLGGWLIHDYRRSNPVFWQVIGQELGTITRPCYLHIPPKGEPPSSHITWTLASSSRRPQSSPSTVTERACWMVWEGW